MTRPEDGPADSFEVLGHSDDADLNVRPSRDRFDRAAQAGRRRRRRKLAVFVVGSTVAVFAVGAAILPKGDQVDRLVATDDGVPPTESSAVDTSVAAPTSVPATTVPSSSPASSVAPATPTVPATGQPDGPDASTGSPSDVFVTVSAERPAVIDVRNTVDVVASFDLGCPTGHDCSVQSARVMGDTIWVAITEAEPGGAYGVVRSRVASVSQSTGEIVEHLSLDGTAAVRSAGLGSNGLLYAHLDQSFGGPTLVAVEAGQVRVLETDVSGFRLSDDGRFLAVAFSDPPAGEAARFEISDLDDQTTVGLDTGKINAGPAAWSPDGRFLIVNEQWEDGTAWVIDPWSGSGDPLPGTEILDGACFMSDRQVAHRTWNIGYGQGNAQPGVIRLTSLDTGSTAAEFGDDIFGDAFRCHPDGSISYLRRPVVQVESSPDFTQPEPDYEAPVELIHIAADGTITNRAMGNLRMV